MQCQHWIVRDQLVDDNLTLAELRINSWGNTVHIYMYVKHPGEVEVSKPTMDRMIQQITGIPETKTVSHEHQ